MISPPEACGLPLFPPTHVSHAPCALLAPSRHLSNQTSLSVSSIFMLGSYPQEIFQLRVSPVFESKSNPFLILSPEASPSFLSRVFAKGVLNLQAMPLTSPSAAILP